MPNDTTPEFALIELSTDKASTRLNFEIIANCAQQKKGVLSISRDTLRIEETDVTISSITYTKDSAELLIEIAEETHIAEVASCDCLMNFYYEFSTPLKDIKYINFHERIYKIENNRR